jgi:transcriptional regulator with XRE-family HTH domain
MRDTHDSLMEKFLSDPINKAEYDKLEEEFAILSDMLEARAKAGKTQEDVAKALGTTKSAISRLENCGKVGTSSSSPTLKTLRKYANAVGCTLQIKLIPSNK